MEFAVYQPPQEASEPCPMVWYLSGSTCNWENATVKVGFRRMAAVLGLIVVAPDTSPRGEGAPDAPDGAYDFGLGAGFCVNATEGPWARHYRMHDYVAEELPALIVREFPMAAGPAGIMGHSMGGHGALTVATRRSEPAQLYQGSLSTTLGIIPTAPHNRSVSCSPGPGRPPPAWEISGRWRY